MATRVWGARDASRIAAQTGYAPPRFAQLWPLGLSRSHGCHGCVEKLGYHSEYTTQEKIIAPSFRRWHRTGNQFGGLLQRKNGCGCQTHTHAPALILKLNFRKLAQNASLGLI